MEGGDIRMNCLKDHNPLQTPFHSVRCLELIVSFFAFAKYGDFQDLNCTYNKKISYVKKIDGGMSRNHVKACFYSQDMEEFE